jgi:hypothetical protein
MSDQRPQPGSLDAPDPSGAAEIVTPARVPSASGSQTKKPGAWRGFRATPWYIQVIAWMIAICMALMIGGVIIGIVGVGGSSKTPPRNPSGGVGISTPARLSSRAGSDLD